MLFYTHLVFALFIGLLFIKYSQQDFLILIPLLIGSFLPDIDNPKSKIGKNLPIISHLIKFTLGHRGIFHSLVFLIFLFIIFYTLINKTLAIFISIGYLSHLLLDSLTKSGIKPFYPFKFRIQGLIKTGSLIEQVFFILLLITVIILFINIL